MTPRIDPAVGPYYLAGPMSGLPLFNFPAFRDARVALRSLGFTIWCPAEADELAGFAPAPGDITPPHPLAYYMERDLPAVCGSAGVIVLPGHETSRGAQIELAVARALGLPIYRYPALWPLDEPLPETILEEANRIIHGPRRDGYGHPLENFSNTAALWTAHLRNRRLLAASADIAPQDVGWMMLQVKQARELNKHQRDNLADAAGYVGTIAMVWDELTRLATEGVQP